MLAMRTRPGALAAVIGVLLVRFLVAPEEQLPLRQDSMRFPLRIVAGVALVGVGIEAQGGDGVLPLVLNPLPLGSVTPNGWLKSELQLEASGLAGNQHSFFQYVTDSTWTGGQSEYSDLNEGLPYWFNGLVPLAYALNDDGLKSQVHTVANQVLQAQQSDGWIGPETPQNRNFWARFPFMLGLTNLVDANATWEQPAVSAMSKFYDLMHSMLTNDYAGYQYHSGDGISEGDTTWGRVRYQDMIISLIWMYENHGDAMSSPQTLLDNMNFLINGSLSWNDWYNDGTYIRGDLWQVGTADNLGQWEHGVNTGQGLKAPAVDRRVTKNDSLVQTAMNAVNWTFSYHGAASGTVLADERIDGLSPWSGSELCTAVETMYSLTYLYQSLGDPYYADYAERTTFNALPASMTPDWWAHQYMAQPNQPYSQNLSTSPFSTSHTYAQSFGLDPEYPCCLVNHPQGLPKFTMGTFSFTGDNGLAHTLLSPATATTHLSGSGGAVTVDCETNYPFGSTLNYKVQSDGPFDFYVRVPSWFDSANSSIAVGSDAGAPLSPDPATGLHHVSLGGGANTVTYNLASAVRTEPRANDTVAVFHGPLLYALDIPNTNSSRAPLNALGTGPNPNPEPIPSQSQDWVFQNSTPWNYAIDTSTLNFKQSGSDSDELSSPIFAPGAPPVSISARACQIDWPLWLDSVPGAPPTGDARQCVSDPVDVTLVPYGSAKTRMGELPTIDLGGK